MFFPEGLGQNHGCASHAAKHGITAAGGVCAPSVPQLGGHSPGGAAFTLSLASSLRSTCFYPQTLRGACLPGNSESERALLPWSRAGSPFPRVRTRSKATLGEGGSTPLGLPRCVACPRVCDCDEELTVLRGWDT